MTRGDNASVSLILVFAWSVFQPTFYHGASLQFCFLAWSADDPPLHLNARRMNGDGPLLSLDPRADRVSYAPVFHRVKFGPKSADWAMRSGGPTRHSGSPRISPSCRSCCERLDARVAICSNGC